VNQQPFAVTIEPTAIDKPRNKPLRLIWPINECRNVFFAESTYVTILGELSRQHP
jgi:hypothetical protein